MAEPAFDRTLLVVVALLLVVGWIVTTSASMDFAADRLGAPWHYAIRHLLYIGIALAAGVATFILPLSVWQKVGGIALLVVVALLLIARIPGIGLAQLGAQRWINLGFITLQPSECAKFAMVVFMAGYLTRREYQVRNEWQGLMLPVLVLALLSALVLWSNDFGSTLIIAAVTMGMLFLAGVNLRYFSVLLGVVLSALVVAVILEPYRLRRLGSYVDPWAQPFGDGFQVVQSLIAFGRGEWLGVGLGNSIQKLSYLTQAHTDFVYAIWAEETGFVGAVAVVALFVVLVGRILLTARKALAARQIFGMHLCYGVAMLFAGQAFINMAVSAGLVPAKGLTLPLISYGGNSLIVSACLLALVLRTHYEIARDAQAGAR
ncbi:MAG: putative lipid II flippase FtsW [Gammaproteobacteria bacterium]|nr:MAG: putative lipid II flippase FtsW [Gammaproteobacteria bacterium]